MLHGKKHHPEKYKFDNEKNQFFQSFRFSYEYLSLNNLGFRQSGIGKHAKADDQ